MIFPALSASLIQPASPSFTALALGHAPHLVPSRLYWPPGHLCTVTPALQPKGSSKNVHQTSDLAPLLLLKSFRNFLSPQNKIRALTLACKGPQFGHAHFSEPVTPLSLLSTHSHTALLTSDLLKSFPFLRAPASTSLHNRRLQVSAEMPPPSQSSLLCVPLNELSASAFQFPLSAVCFTKRTCLNE